MGRYKCLVCLKRRIRLKNKKTKLAEKIKREVTVSEELPREDDTSNIQQDTPVEQETQNEQRNQKEVEESITIDDITGMDWTVADEGAEEQADPSAEDQVAVADEVAEEPADQSAEDLVAVAVETEEPSEPEIPRPYFGPITLRQHRRNSTRAHHAWRLYRQRRVMSSLPRLLQCSLCLEHRQHWTSQCIVYFSVKERRERLEVLGVCYRCLGHHTDQDFSCTVVCSTCSGPHNSVICCHPRANYSRNRTLEAILAICAEIDNSAQPWTLT